MDDETFIEKLTSKLSKGKNETVDTRIEAFVLHGEYLNNIPIEYHPIMVELLSNAIYLYCMGIDEYYRLKNKTFNNTSTQPIIKIRQDIKSLQKAREIIHEKIFYKYFKFSSIDVPKMENFSDEDRKKYNDEHQTTIKLHSDDSRVDIIKDAEQSKRIYDTYCTLTDMIIDLEKQEFEIFLKNSYYPVKKPNKNEIKELLEIVKYQFNLKPSHNEAQLIAAL